MPVNPTIYALLEPNDCAEIRYVGKANDLKVRLQDHMDDARYARSGLRVHRWIRKLSSLGLVPLQKPLVIADSISWQTLERYCIQHFKEAGADLTNHTDGGEGVVGLTEEIRKKIREANSRRVVSSVTRARMALAKRGKSQTEEHVRKRAALRRGRPISEENRRNLCAAWVLRRNKSD